MWTYSDDLTLLPNLIVRSRIEDGILQFYQIYPVEGYVLWIPLGDEYEYDENGELILDENGNPIFVARYYTLGGAVVMPNYDFETNPSEFQAVLYEEGMTVFGENPILETE